ncbi:hypothetical protein VTK73DRAFT_3738 [Phialemonium thermophilum]|uniref:Amino acid permease/ SLC12A domain-containing protein n=1 Tax=Phialemonium thermophilum TaxID=223376 RepID=A0ABR3XZJ7_9PEZI
MAVLSSGRGGHVGYVKLIRKAPTSVSDLHIALSTTAGLRQEIPDNHRSEMPLSDGGIPIAGFSPGSFKREVSTRQMFLMAAGGSIGAGIFVGSGQALAIGGPANLVINFALCGLMACLTMAALGEMATSYPVSGAFYDYTLRFVGPQWGFAMGWNYVLNWLLIVPFEMTTIGVLLQYWNPEIRVWHFVPPSLVLLAVGSINGAKWFSEVKNCFCLCKILTISSFVGFALVLTVSGIPGDPRGALRGRYWHDPGAFLNGFQGFLSVLRFAGVAYGGTEMLGLAAAECRDPHQALPLATKVVFARVIFLQLGSLLTLGFTVPANSPELSQADHRYSPFVLAASLSGISVLAGFLNAMIIVALFSVANSAIFSSSCALQALCVKRMGPKVLARTTSKNVPLHALTVSLTVALLALIGTVPGGEDIFDWLLSLSSTSSYLTWASICYSHTRMRRAMTAQGHSLEHLSWRSPFGTAGSYVGLAICCVSILAQIVVAFWPLDEYEIKAVIRDIIGIPFTLLLFTGYV